jgi:uncharacterized membrane protein
VGSLIIGVIALAALGAVALGGRHLYLRASRPRGFDCSVRIAEGEVPGLTRRFRAGYAGREMDTFVWRRLAWPSPPVRFPAAAVRLDEERAPGLRDHLVSVPASFAVVPVTLGDGCRIDLALPRRKRDRIVAALGPSTAS